MNKFGVPYHQYELHLSDGDSTTMDVGYEEDWGNVQPMMPDDFNGRVPEDWFSRIGWGNDLDGHIEIVEVLDLKCNRILSVREWAENRVWKYVPNYSG